MNVARLNFSHGTHAQHAEVIETIRRVSAELEVPVALLGDLQGPRIRVGDIHGPVNVEPGQDLTLVHEGLEQAGEIPITYDHLASDVHVGDRILINDGLLELVLIFLQLLVKRIAGTARDGELATNDDDHCALAGGGDDE